MPAIESALRSRFEANDGESKKLRKAALGSLRDDLRDQIAKRLKKTRRQLDQSLDTRLDTEATRLSAEIDERAAGSSATWLRRFASLREELQTEVRRSVTDSLDVAGRALEERIQETNESRAASVDSEVRSAVGGATAVLGRRVEAGLEQLKADVDRRISAGNVETRRRRARRRGAGGGARARPRAPRGRNRCGRAGGRRIGQRRDRRAGRRAGARAGHRVRRQDALAQGAPPGAEARAGGARAPDQGGRGPDREAGEGHSRSCPELDRALRSEDLARLRDEVASSASRPAVSSSGWPRWSPLRRRRSASAWRPTRRRSTLDSPPPG